MDWIYSAIICFEENVEKLKTQRAIGFERNVVENFKEFNINEMKGIILIKIENNNLTGDLVISSDDAINKPNEIFLFSEEESNDEVAAK